MAGPILFVISSDPRVSHRPAEALRIAAGVSAWKRVEVQVCLCGPAVLLASEEQELRDGEEARRWLAMLTETGPVYVEASNPVLAGLDGGGPRRQEVSQKQLAELAAHSASLLKF